MEIKKRNKKIEIFLIIGVILLMLSKFITFTLIINKKVESIHLVSLMQSISYSLIGSIIWLAFDKKNKSPWILYILSLMLTLMIMYYQYEVTQNIGYLISILFVFGPIFYFWKIIKETNIKIKFEKNEVGIWMKKKKKWIRKLRK